MTPIDIQDIAAKNVRLLCGNSMQKVFDLYMMIVEDYYYRQYNLIVKDIGDYIKNNYVDVKDLAIGDENEFYINNSNDN